MKRLTINTGIVVILGLGIGWVLVWLLPYAQLGFQNATDLWLLTNIAALFFSMMVSWQLLTKGMVHVQRQVWLPFLAAVLFPSTLVALLFGQVNILVLVGLVGYLFFYDREQDIVAGLLLGLTTFKILPANGATLAPSHLRSSAVAISTPASRLETDLGSPGPAAPKTSGIDLYNHLPLRWPENQLGRFT